MSFSASAAVISIDLERTGDWSGNSAVTAVGDEGGTGVFATGLNTAWNSWLLGSLNSAQGSDIVSGALATRDSSATANTVQITLKAGPQAPAPKYRTLEISGGNAVHRDGLQIQHENSSANIVISGLIAGNPYDIRVHTMDRGGGVHVNPQGTGLSSNIPTSDDGVFAGIVADGSGEINLLVTNNGAYRDETIGGIEIAGDFVNVIPEPSSLALLGLGGLLIARRRRG